MVGTQRGAHAGGMDENLAALITLVLAGGPPAPRHALARHPRGLAAALAAGLPLWTQAGCTPAQLTALAQPEPTAFTRAWHWLQQPGHALLHLDDPRLPQTLRELPDPPFALFVDGDPAALWKPSIAVVGSRSPTPSGRALASEFSLAFARHGLAVVSGLAAGIDAAAHRAVLGCGGDTLAVIGTGPDRAYPDHHVALQAEVAACGAVVSEYPPGTPARAGQFPARNRLVAGLALLTLVVEAAWRSGALITARLAAEAGREVCAIPGSVRNPRARGCHRLIREGAALVETPEEVLALVAPSLSRALPGLKSALEVPIQELPAATLPPAMATDADYQRLWNALDHDPIPMDSLIMRCGLTASGLSSMLLAMELAGIVVCEHGRYCRNPGFPTSTAS